MSGTIFTPTTLWNDFNNAPLPVKELVYSIEQNDKRGSKFFIKGLTIKGEKLDIFAKLYQVVSLGKTPVILLLNSFDNKKDDVLIEEFLKDGYAVCVFDFLGKVENKLYYTSFPKSVEYAKYKCITDNFYNIEGEVKDSPWYIWGAMAKYVVKHLSTSEQFSKVGIFACEEMATLGWIASATEEGVDCSVFLFNSGWANYRNHYRYSVDTDSKIGSWEMRYIAGFDPQTYAQHIKKPVLLLTSTNNMTYDVDRAYTTISRIDSSIFSAVHYSIGLTNSINYEGYKDLLIFYSTFLKKDLDKKQLPLDLTISSSQDENGVINIEVKTREDDIQELKVYYSDNEVNPALRSYHTISESEQISPNVYLFKIIPNDSDENFCVFAKMTLNSGFSSCSDIVFVKNINYNETNSSLYNVLYSNKLDGEKSAFAPASEVNSLCSVIDIKNENDVVVKMGAKDIFGIYCKNGIKTNKVGSKNCKIKEDSILMFDVCSKLEGNLVIKLLCDICGNNIEYKTAVSLIGGNVWQNIKLEINKLKDEVGQAIKENSYINALSFESDVQMIFNGIIII